MDGLTPSRSLDNIFSQEDEAFLNMLFSNSTLNEASATSSTSPTATISSSPADIADAADVLGESVAPASASSTFFFNGDNANDDTLATTGSTDASVTSSIELPMLLPVKPELDEPLFAALPDIFPTIDDVATPESDEFELSSEGLASPDVKSEAATSGRKKKNVKKAKATGAAAKKKVVKVKAEEEKDKKKRGGGKGSGSDGGGRPGKKQKVDNLSPFIRTLKGMDSIRLEEYAASTTLSPQQQAELKDWIRKIKNRESASNSRKNRKSHQQILEARLEDLGIMNGELQEGIKVLEIENRVLRGELKQFRLLIERSNLGQAFEQYNRVNGKITNADGDVVSAPTTTTTTTTTSAVDMLPVPTPIPDLPPATVDAASTTSEETKTTATAMDQVDNDSATIATPTAVLPVGTKDQIETYRAQTLARLGEAVAKMVQRGKARREDVALVLYLLIVLHQCGQFLTTGQLTQQQSQQLSIPASSEAISVVV